MMSRRVRSGAYMQGFAMVVVMIIIVVGFMIGALMMARSSGLMSKIGFQRKASEIELKALSGLNRAKADLMDISLVSKFANVKDESGAAMTDEQKVKVGLVPNPDLTHPRVIVPRFVISDKKFGSGSGGIMDSKSTYETKIYYFPSDHNGDIANYDNVYPKAFTLVSEVKNLQSGEVFTAEALLQFDLFAGTGTMSYALVGSKPDPANPNQYTPLPIGVKNFEIKPAEHIGEVFFGNYRPQDLKFSYTHYNNDDLDNDGVGEAQLEKEHVFREPVHFMRKNSSGPNAKPYSRVDGVSVDFQKGYVVEEEETSDWQDSGPQLDQMISSIRHETTANGNGSTRPKPKTIAQLISDYEDASPLAAESDVCIEYHMQDGQAKMGLHTCDPANPNPEHRYGPLLESIDLADSEYRYLDCGDRNCHIKGIVGDDIMIVSDPPDLSQGKLGRDITIEGDLVYNYDPSSSVQPRLQVVAGRNLVVPPTIPFQSPLPESYKPLKSDGTPEDTYRLNGVTNYIVPGSPDLADPAKLAEYDYDQNGNPINVQSGRVLDLHGAFFAPNGALVLDGLWNPEQSLTTPYDPAYFQTGGFWDPNNTEIYDDNGQLKVRKANEDMLGMTIWGVSIDDSNGTQQAVAPKVFDATRVAQLDLPLDVLKNPGLHYQEINAEMKKDKYKNNGLEPYYFFSYGDLKDGQGNVIGQGYEPTKRYDAMPAMCAMDVPLEFCKTKDTLLRQKSELLWINGMLITRDYSWTQRNFNGKLQGFRRKMVFADPQFALDPPEGFVSGIAGSSSGQAVKVIWQKAYKGASQILRNKLSGGD